ncbi:hypothetical protein JHK84_027498 [Glycine max]|nr:hypothetical protein JHK84_027498 [Glycine max]KAH1228194.1 Protein MAINTENANCE OF MERISTEMS [Glycine max]
MDNSKFSMMEVREDFMVSATGDSEPTSRSAYFLKPLANSLDGPVSEVISSSMAMPLPPVFDPKQWPMVVRYNGWHHPKPKWVEWVDTLQVRYQSLWKKVGIFDAIMSTKCSIAKNQNLCVGIAERWCPDTNTFLFPWGEATITLEDVMVLGGFPVVGDPVFTTLQSQEMRKVEEKLSLARMEPWREKKHKVTTSAWMDAFVNSGTRSEIEHEAFLSTWLTMVGFSHNGLVNECVFPIAILLARGYPIALGPAVLASIYHDLTLLKKTIVRLAEKSVLDDKLELMTTLQSPFYLIQIWVWERFKNLQPQPKLINHEDPVLFRWHKVKALEIDNVRLAVESAMDHFRWRPYVQYAGTGKFKVYYPENETLVILDTDLDKEPTGILASFVACLKVSLLVGIQSNIELYLPHRVAMQFGMDQDVPSCVPIFRGTKENAWKNYCRPISDTHLYFPARLFEGDVTTRYATWWKQLVPSCHRDFVKNIVRRKRSLMSHVSKANKNSGNDADVPPGFSPSKTLPSGNSGQDDLQANENIDADIPTRFKSLSNPISSASTADYEKAKRISSLTKPAAEDTPEPLMSGLDEQFEDANGRKESRPSESCSCASRVNLMDLEERINRLEEVTKKLKMKTFGHC